MRVASAAVFVLVGLAAVSILWDEQNTEAFKAVVGQAIAEFTVQKLPDASPGISPAPIIAPTETPDQSNVPVATVTPVPTLAPVATATPIPTQVPSAAPVATATPLPTPIPVAAPASYTVQRGDTLIRISILNYGDESMVQEICDLNEITNPDDIKFGDKILLP